MKGITLRIIIAIVGIFFMLSASEISTKYFTNTFGDAYDYYILPDNSQATTIFNQVIFDLTFAIIPFLKPIYLPIVLFFIFSIPLYFRYSIERLYLKNRILII